VLDFEWLEAQREPSPDPRVIDFDERAGRQARWLFALVLAILVIVVVGALFIAPAGAGGGSCGGA